MVLTCPGDRALLLSMEVIVLTTFFSVLFAILFLLFFLRVRQNGDACADQDALLPLLDEDPLPTPPSSQESTEANHPSSRYDQ